MLRRDPRHQRLGPVTPGHPQQVAPSATAFRASAATSTISGPSSMATSAPSASAFSFSPNFATFPPPTSGSSR